MLLTPVAPFAACSPAYPSGLRPAAGAAPSTATTPVPPPATALRSGVVRGSLSLPKAVRTKAGIDALITPFLNRATRTLQGWNQKTGFSGLVTMTREDMIKGREGSSIGHRITVKVNDADFATIRVLYPKGLLHRRYRTGLIGRVQRWLDAQNSEQLRYHTTLVPTAFSNRNMDTLTYSLATKEVEGPVAVISNLGFYKPFAERGLAKMTKALLKKGIPISR